MPNHCMNMLRVKGDDKKIEAFLATVKGEPNSCGEPNHLDINKIIPMPSSLDIEEGAHTEMGLALYDPDGDEFKKLLSSKINMKDGTPVKTHEQFVAYVNEDTPEIVEEIRRLGKIALENIAAHGHRSWYNWRMEHWGTKWELYDFNDVALEPGTCDIQFSSAWNPPIPIIKALSEQYPDLQFGLVYCELGNWFAGAVTKDGTVEATNDEGIKTIAREAFCMNLDEDDE